ncbi:MAG TPA: hypothetical protein VF412_05900 [Bdellovibrio sp.]|uniref:hypothetical protein n=1 Tax=Bdellovibrio sp. TaxID=28201 RepID=UPI002F05BB97
MRSAFFALLVLIAISFAEVRYCHAMSATQKASTLDTAVDDDDDDSPLKLVGERLFRETRFSQFFYSHSRKSLNQVLSKGDPVVETLDTIAGKIQNPYRGQAISCAGCHFVEQATDIRGGGSRAYTDFSRRSAIPNRGDGLFETPRNSPIMVGSTANPNYFLHDDGEFESPEDLVRSSYFGRNLGWLPGEGGKAAAHMAAVIRQDDGSFPTETDLKGYSYKKLLAGDPSLPAKFQIPEEYRFDVDQSTDQQVVDGVIHLVAGYLNSLDFKKDKDGNYRGSPFDVFLRKNNLPQRPNQGEGARDYTVRLAKMIVQMKSVQPVTSADGSFTLHNQDFTFSEDEIRGFLIFAGRGGCAECHSAPDFTDHVFHNNGASQLDYDDVHDSGAFMRLPVPTLAQRNSQAALYLPASDANPTGQGVFRHAPSTANAMYADLGVWNIFGNPDMPRPQALMRKAICYSMQIDCDRADDETILAGSLGMIKTPTLRDLGQTAPYMHTGQIDTIADALIFYMKTSEMSRMGVLRNSDPRMKMVNITADDMSYLEKFLKSLNEDYD